MPNKSTFKIQHTKSAYKTIANLWKMLFYPDKRFCPLRSFCSSLLLITRLRLSALSTPNCTNIQTSKQPILIISVHSLSSSTLSTYTSTGTTISNTGMWSQDHGLGHCNSSLCSTMKCSWHQKYWSWSWHRSVHSWSWSHTLGLRSWQWAVVITRVKLPGSW